MKEYDAIEAKENTDKKLEETIEITMEAGKYIINTAALIAAFTPVGPAVVGITAAAATGVAIADIIQEIIEQMDNDKTNDEKTEAAMEILSAAALVASVTPKGRIISGVVKGVEALDNFVATAEALEGARNYFEKVVYDKDEGEEAYMERALDKFKDSVSFPIDEARTSIAEGKVAMKEFYKEHIKKVTTSPEVKKDASMPMV